jgi:hypothetical protein
MAAAAVEHWLTAEGEVLPDVDGGGVENIEIFKFFLILFLIF